MISAPSVAGPWIESDDPLLRASIEMLFNQGVIKQPINSYPLNVARYCTRFSLVDSNNLHEQSFLLISMLSMPLIMPSKKQIQVFD